MAKCIDRDALIKELEADFNSDWNGYSKAFYHKEYVDGVRDEYDDVLKIICSMETTDVQPNRWISVDERLPQDNKDVLVYAGRRGVMIGLYYSFLQTWLDYEGCGLKVTHWQPLPKPPKEDDDA